MSRGNFDRRQWWRDAVCKISTDNIVFIDLDLDLVTIENKVRGLDVLIYLGCPVFGFKLLFITLPPL